MQIQCGDMMTSALSGMTDIYRFLLTTISTMVSREMLTISSAPVIYPSHTYTLTSINEAPKKGRLAGSLTWGITYRYIVLSDLEQIMHRGRSTVDMRLIPDRSNGSHIAILPSRTPYISLSATALRIYPSEIMQS